MRSAASKYSENGGEFIGKKSEERTSAALYEPCYIGVRQNEAARTVVKIN